MWHCHGSPPIHTPLHRGSRRLLRQPLNQEVWGCTWSGQRSCGRPAEEARIKAYHAGPIDREGNWPCMGRKITEGIVMDDVIHRDYQITVRRAGGRGRGAGRCAGSRGRTSKARARAMILMVPFAWPHAIKSILHTVNLCAAFKSIFLLSLTSSSLKKWKAISPKITVSVLIVKGCMIERRHVPLCSHRPSFPSVRQAMFFPSFRAVFLPSLLCVICGGGAWSAGRNCGAGAFCFYRAERSGDRSFLRERDRADRRRGSRHARDERGRHRAGVIRTPGEVSERAGDCTPVNDSLLDFLVVEKWA